MMIKSSLNEKIRAAIDLLERHQMPVTTDSVRSNMELGWDDATGLVEGAIRSTIRAQMKMRGMVITDLETRERKDFWVTKLSELENQLRIKEDSNAYDNNRLKADKAILTLLREKEIELGYEPYPELFRMDIDRIYAMHGLASP